MFQPIRPTSTTLPTVTRTNAPPGPGEPGGPPLPTNTPMGVQSTGAQGNVLDGVFGAIGRLFSSIVDFFKRLFGGAGAASVPPVPGATATVPSAVTPQPGVVSPTPVAPTPAVSASGLSMEEEAMAKKQGILATRANFDAFIKEAQALEAAKAIGPSSNETDAIRELQQVLGAWGYAVSQSGQFDMATEQAVLKFKRDNNLKAAYVMADGTPGYHPFIDEATKQAMITKLQASPVAPTPAPTGPAQPVAPQVTVATPTVVVPPTPVTPVVNPYQASGELTAEEQAIAQQQNIQATRSNFDAFMKEAQALETQNAIGPGSTNADAVRELQGVLAGWGYAVSANGQFDQATADAVLKFKRDNNLKSPYLLADGSAAFHPFIDEATKQAMIAKLQTSPTPAPQPTPAPVTPVVNGYQASGDLTAEEQAIAREQNIQATRANFDAFMKEAQALETQNAIGPGSTNADAVRELQGVLAGWGYAVSANGQFDQATADAVLKFKRDNNLKASYVMADGSAAFHAFIDEATKQAMVAKLQTTPAPAVTPTPAPATPVVTPVTNQYQATSELTAEEQAIAQQQNIQATRSNFDAFMKEAQALETQNAIGPGSTNADAVRELQGVLAGWGYAVSANGQFDQATADAVLKFKRDNNLKSPYLLADGSAAFHPFIDQTTQQAMIAKLQTTPAVTPTPAPQPTPVANPGVNQYQGASELTAEERAIASENGLEASRANMDAFLAEARALESSRPVGPGNAPADSVNELQQVLAGWGYAVSVNGQFDQATTDAVLKFKRDNNLHAAYKLADGSFAFHPYVDDATRAAMVRKLGG